MNFNEHWYCFVLNSLRYWAFFSLSVSFVSFFNFCIIHGTWFWCFWDSIPIHTTAVRASEIFIVLKWNRKCVTYVRFGTHRALYIGNGNFTCAAHFRGCPRVPLELRNLVLNLITRDNVDNNLFLRKTRVLPVPERGLQATAWMFHCRSAVIFCESKCDLKKLKDHKGFNERKTWK